MVTHGDELVISSVHPSADGIWSERPLLGRRMPFAPPLGALFAAFGNDRDLALWRRRWPGGGEVDEHAIESQRARVRERGFSVAYRDDAHADFEDAAEEFTVGSHNPSNQRRMLRTLGRLRSVYDPADLRAGRVRLLSVPAFDRSGGIAFQIAAHDLPGTLSVADQEALANEISETAHRIAALLKGSSA